VASSSVLLVEGNDDQHVVWGLLEHFKIPEVFDVREKGGIEALLKILPVQLKASEIQRVGIVIDADVELSRSWNKVRNILQAASFQTVPELPILGGTILKEPGLPHVGVWIMPDNKLPGMLEDFVRLLIPDEDGILPHVEASIAAIPEGSQLFIGTHKPKAVIHTWLAWQETPGCPMGLAIKKRYLNPKAPNAVEFIKWVTDLFVDQCYDAE
jgi:hypothetical protein